MTHQQSIEAAKGWLLGMQNPSGGFAGSFSFIHGRRPDFAEVTGYIIPTLIKLGELEAARKAGEWLLSIQNPEGWFFHWPAPDRPMVFDTGQAVFGLLALAQYSCHSPAWRGNLDPRLRGDDKKGDKYLQAAVKAGDWICSVQESDGVWRKYAYQGIAHTYYSRVSWALLELWKITGDEKYKSAAVRQLDWVLAQQREDGSFKNCSFFADDNPVLHVIAYTIEGLLYSGLILSTCDVDRGNKFIEAAERGLRKLPSDSWSCLTGLAQLSCICFKLWDIANPKDLRCPYFGYLKQARRINRYLKTKHILRGPKTINGALPGSYPIWKRYMPFSLPVWSAKFWLDALLWEEKFRADYLTAAIFPNDSLRVYLEKGELRRDYFNPGDIFSEIVIVDAKKSNYSPEEKQQLSWMMGEAKFSIGPIGPIGLIGPMGPIDVIRSYGVGKPAEQAARLSRHLNTPLVISLHGNYDLDNRYQTLRRGALVKYLYYTFRSWFIIPKILKQAAKILAVYQFAADYALSKNIAKDKVAVIYNRVYPDIFFPSADKKRKKFTLIMVGRLISEKNQQCLIRAIQNLDVQLIIVGQGPEKENLKKLSESLGIANGVEFVNKTDNKEMANLYNQAHAYVTANQYGGVEIPVIEAMACGLPIIRSKHPLEKEPELLGFNGCLCVENNPESFAKAIKRIMNDESLRKRLSQKSLEIYQSINGCKMEEKEKKLVLSVL